MMRCPRALLIALACTGCAACAANGVQADDELGRLFFTPAQRAQLNAARANPNRQPPASPEAAPTAAQGPGVVTYGGVVRRGDGKSTVWINGKPMSDHSRDGEVSVLGVRRDGAVSIAVPQSERSASLRVGQSMDVVSGSITESYARRETRDNPVPKPAPAAASASSTTGTTSTPNTASAK